MLELGHDAFADVFTLLLVLRNIACKGIEDGDSSPLGTFVQRNEEFVQDRGCDCEYCWIG